MIGAASVLAALFRAPLTASMVLFELTRDYDVILPLMVTAGLGSLVGDILDDKFELAKRRRDQDTVSWGDLASRGSESNKEADEVDMSGREAQAK
jgi:H+/Cl- antiporter ClcA